jgi:aminopeptidase-like protein
MDDSGKDLHRWASDLFPLPRSLTGDGVRETLKYLAALLPELEIGSIPSGSTALDWTVPDEWHVRTAYIETPSGELIADWSRNNLHLVGYSEPVSATLSRAELLPHLHTLPDKPTAIPYVTSYYAKSWGFCLSHEDYVRLGEGPFRVIIDSEFKRGEMNFAHAIIPGDSTREVLLSSYVCHPSMANNELSGPVVLTAVGRWLKSLPRRRYTYRLVLAPETIGCLAYLSQHLEVLRERVDAGWVLTCVGDDRAYSYLESRMGDTLADRITQAVLSERHPEYIHYTYLDRGSDERQWCAPGIDLPVCSVMRSKYETYPEYHTSLDDLTLVTPRGLQGSLDLLKSCILALEACDTYETTVLGEPFMTRHGLYPTLSNADSFRRVKAMMDVIAYCDGSLDTLQLAQRVELPVSQTITLLRELENAGIVKRTTGVLR